MKNKTINELAQLLNSDDTHDMFSALTELEYRKIDASITNALEQALFSDELTNLDKQFMAQAKQTIDARSITALAYGLYEIDIFRNRIVQLLRHIETEWAHEIVEKWESHEEK